MDERTASLPLLYLNSHKMNAAQITAAKKKLENQVCNFLLVQRWSFNDGWWWCCCCQLWCLWWRLGRGSGVLVGVSCRQCTEFGCR